MRILVKFGWIARPFLELFQGARHHKHVVGETEIRKTVSFFITQFDAQAFAFPSFYVFLHRGLDNRETAQSVAVFCPTSAHQSERWHAGRRKVFFKQMYCSLIECFLRVPDSFVLYGVECLLDVYRCHPHVCSPLSAFLGYEFVRLKVVRSSECLSESCLIGTLVPIKHGA